MKLLFLLFLSAACVYGQIYNYDFGNDVGSHETDTSTVFLPQPPAGSARVRVGSGGGGFYLENPGIESFGSASELKGAASSTSSVNKFSIYGYPGGRSFYIAYLIRFSGGASGKWYFCAGNGSTYSNNALFRSDQSFSALRWTYLQPDSLLCEYRKGSSWKKLPAAANKQNMTYLVEIYGNNQQDTLRYQKQEEERLGPGTFDLWINNTLAGEDLQKALLPDSLPVNSFMFYGANSDSNSALIYLDDIIYSDSINIRPSSLQNQKRSAGKETGFILYNNYPNPFNPATNIRFELPMDKISYAVKLSIYDLRGKLVDNIYIGRLKAGYYNFPWRAKNFLSSGDYIVRLQADDFSLSRKITLIK